MNLLGPDIRHEIIVLINDKGEHRLLAPKCANAQEVMVCCDALFNAAASLAAQYGIQVSLTEPKKA